MVGTVTSNKMNKTVVVVVERLVKSKLYNKYIRRSSSFAVHSEGHECQIGDRVLITESRPLSRGKRWRVSKIVEKAV